MTKIFVDRDSINDESVIVRKVHASSGARVEAGTLVLEYETSKTTVECNAAEPGVISIVVKEGEEIAVGSLLYEITPGQTQQVSEMVRAQQLEIGGARAERSRAHLSQAALAAAKELNIDLDAFPEGDWVTAHDIRALASKKTDVGMRGQAMDAAHSYGDDRKSPGQPVAVHFLSVPSSLRKRAENRSLTEGNSHGAVSTIGIDIQLNGVRLVRPPALFADNIADIVIFESARLLRRYPELNGFYIDDRRNGQYEEVNVGVAFDDGENLKVLAIRDADRRTLREVQREFTSLLELYESRAPIPQELLTGATVTLSDLSRSKASYVKPLVNGRQSMILGITRSATGFAFHASFDHRVSEGLRVAKFLEQLTANVASYYSESTGESVLRCSACHRSMMEELSMGHRGLIKLALPGGGEALLCRTCFEGI